MTHDEAVARLAAYEAECQGILKRFVKGRESWNLADGDDARFEPLVIELRDFFDDTLGKNSYSSMVVDAYNQGVRNMYGTPSYNSVQRVGGIVSAALVRLKQHPELMKKNSADPVKNQEPLVMPDTVTLHWLFRHVPYSLWAMLFGALLAAFVLGIQATKLSIVQEWFGLPSHSQSK